MYKHEIFLLFLFSSLMILSVSVQTNLIENPGFETSGDLPDDGAAWAVYGWTIIADANAFEGEYVGTLSTDSWYSGIYIVNIMDNKDRKSVYKVVK